MPCEAPEFTEFSGRGGPIVIACATVSDVTRVLEAVQKGDPPSRRSTAALGLRLTAQAGRF